MSDSLRRTALHATHTQLGARLVPFAGYEMPIQYSSIKQEHAAVRDRAGLFDVSHMGQIELRGPRAIQAAEALVTCEVSSLSPGRARYGLLLNEAGGCIDDVMLTRVADDALFLCVNASNVQTCLEWIQARAGDRVEVENRSQATSLLALQGPSARAILEAIVSQETPLPRRFRVAHCELAGLRTLVSGTGYTGSPGFEIYSQNADAPALWQALLEAGAEHGIEPAGLGARDTLRLEAALPLYGHELDTTTTPFEAALGRFVKPLDRGFVGAAALAERADEPDPRRLVGLEMIGRGIARAEHPIQVRGETVGVVTSGGPSPTLGKSIGLGYVPRHLSRVGTSVDVVIREKPVEARLVETPFL
jgi:aminomethyltransferase